METVAVQLSLDTIRRLQEKSALPAVEGVEGIIRRLIDEHTKAYPASTPRTVIGPHPAEPTTFKTSRGFELPVGLDLFADYNGKHLTAKVTRSGIEYKGKAYEVSPSAFQAKKDCGATDTAASTNGWKFWMFNKDGRADFIDAFRPRA
jgi:hypothetical protein